MPLTTPQEITEHVEELCASINPSAALQWVKVEPDPKATINFCFRSVVTTERAGTPLVGWIIWERPGAFVEAEMHCVLKKPDGSLVDIVPKRDGEGEILFLPDHDHPMTSTLLSLTTGLAPPNRRLLLRKHNRLLEDWLKAAEDLDAAKRGNYSGDLGDVVARFEKLNQKLLAKYS